MHYRETLNVASLSIGPKFLRFAGALSKGFVGSLIVLALAGCDSTESPPKPPAPAVAAPATPAPPAKAESPAQNAQQTLEQRAVERWDALVARNFELAYTFETPSYRKVYTAEQFKRKFGTRVAWLGARVNTVKELGNGVAEVMIKLRFKAAVPIPGMEAVQDETNLKEKWVQEEGTWFHVTE